VRTDDPGWTSVCIEKNTYTQQRRFDQEKSMYNQWPSEPQ
jgi:hypothetical protein